MDKAIPSPLVIESLKNILIPCMDDNAQSAMFKILDLKMAKFNGEDFLKMDPSDQVQCLDFMLETTRGTKLDSKYNEFLSKMKIYNIDNPIWIDEFIYMKVKSIDKGEFEIRVNNY